MNHNNFDLRFENLCHSKELQSLRLSSVFQNWIEILVYISFNEVFIWFILTNQIIEI